MKNFSMTRDINGYNGFGLEFPDGNDDNYQFTLSADVAQSVTAPGTSALGGMRGSGTGCAKNRYIAIFSVEPGSSVWISKNVTATLPTGSPTLTSSQLNPAGRTIYAGDVLSFITSDTTANIGVSFYEL